MRTIRRVRVLCCHHLKQPVLGYAAGPLLAPELEVTHVDLPRGERLPADPHGFDGIISWGGEDSVRDRHAYIRAEQRLLRDAVEAGVPVLGVCLGAQILASALGSEIRRIDDRTLIALQRVRRLPSAEHDALFGTLPHEIPTLHWHEDCFEPPDGAVELLTRGSAGCEAFRYGPSAWGVQFHPEASPQTLSEWRSQTDDEREHAAADVAARDVEATEGSYRAVADAIFGGFVSVIRARSD